MLSPPSAQIFLFLSFIVFLVTTMLAEDTKEPKKYKVGESATIVCWNPSIENHDITELLFDEKTDTLFTLSISDGDLSKELEVSGTFNKFTWSLTQKKKTSSCTNGNSEGSADLGCPRPGDEENKINLSRGGKNIASFQQNSNYRSRMQYSGNIRNLTVTLSGLVAEDKGCYSCKWKESGVADLHVGSENCLEVENPQSSGARHFCIASAIVNGVLIGYLLFF